jgi:agmatine deiminase
MIRFKAEWEKQTMVQLSWPRANSDWSASYQDAQECFAQIGKSVLRFQKLLIVCENPDEVKVFFTANEIESIIWSKQNYNDSWARDHGGITIERDGQLEIIDFKFTGWGGKFEAELDNLITQNLFKQGIFKLPYQNQLDFILEGGALLSTTKCLLNPNRNPQFNLQQVEQKLTETLGINRFLWLYNGDLEGDDTDAHIDTLARFANPETIVYVQCTDENDSHYSELKKMEEELQNFTTTQGKKYQLIPLPLPTPQFAVEGNYRIPATYANYLVINQAVLLPIYNCISDDLAIQQMQNAFPQHQIIPINCTALIQQHGSLHCVTMQYYH